MSKGARFWGFVRFRESVVLGGNPSIHLDSTSFGGPNRSYGMPMRYSLYPQHLVRIGRPGSGIWGELTSGSLFIPSCLGLTGPIRARSLWDLPRVNCLVHVALGCDVATQFLEGFKVFCLVLWRFFVSFSLSFVGHFAPGPRGVTEAN
jgi:hypothetical protein